MTNLRRCKICRYPKLKSLVDALHNAGYTYRQIIKFLKEKYDIHVSLGTLSHHFTHVKLEKIESLPTLRENEVVLTPNQIDELSYRIVMRYFRNLETEELEKILHRLEKLKNEIEEYPLTTNLTFYLELREIMEKAYPEALETLRQVYIEELERLNIAIEPILEIETANEHRVFNIGQTE